VLAGQGRGNKMVKSGSSDDGSAVLHDVTVSWFNDSDKLVAEEWSENVSHTMFEKTPYGEPEAGHDIPAPVASASPA